MRIEKWQALGNDYLILEEDELRFDLSPERIKRICHPHFGMGSDGILLLSRSEDPAIVASLRIFNPDGSEAELSGNGAREAIMYLRRRGWTDRDSFTITTAAGPISPQIVDERTCRVDMGRAALESKDFPEGGADGKGTLTAAGRAWEFQHVSIGNPQCAIRMERGLEELDLASVGPDLEAHTAFPYRTNVSFYDFEGSRVRARIFERGVGETLSSGTGATGAAVAAHLRGAPSRLTVELDGGELTVEIGPDLEIALTGWAVPVFEGRLTDEFVAELEQLQA